MRESAEVADLLSPGWWGKEPGAAWTDHIPLDFVFTVVAARVAGMGNV